MAFCPKCGNQITNSMKFCPYCKTPIYNQAPVMARPMNYQYGPDQVLHTLSQKEDTAGTIYIVTGCISFVATLVTLVFSWWLILPFFSLIISAFNIYFGTKRKEHSKQILYQPFGIPQYYQDMEAKNIIWIVAIVITLSGIIGIAGPICDLSNKSYVMQNRMAFMQIEKNRYR